ncbi:tRNA (adenosine(37)-N6)-threonylcarbamoyltransferase complex ATPase subunit type 1 TsaE [Winogradskyella sp. PC-19]|uniref:tRNA (adenosine(37)-N6)-threonylcarbamoyltransferase complex ATPase subunit type 1 TsaE n=1 Tax=unclassified Winogradskyella TaxID=2615021 RepID=UPI000B3C995F|nr:MULTISPECIES: tRNA (adenosine(37)-N6)-threonylcarbamoyltransferase complex ATPase subunit type 1 TsaE [unclassified Winogradskyella]ARV08487.1 tRNA (adenosine(37)-N6)-threonylcarbamoyltransferase complex ATPase subunit type 1 TsaE [Winogradskyella sp. PC-19]
MKTEQFTYTLNDIDSIAARLAEQFDAKTILFNGEMGAGKTTLIKAMVKAMGSIDVVTSPTFSIVNEYLTLNDAIYHFDFYRIENIDEAYNFGIEDYFNSNHWLFIEWSERIASLLPKEICIVDISIDTETTRTLKLTTNSNNLTENNAQKQLT